MNSQIREIEDITSHSVDGTKYLIRQNCDRYAAYAIISYAEHLCSNSYKQDHLAFCQTSRPLRQCLHCGGPDNCTKVKCAVAAK